MSIAFKTATNKKYLNPIKNEKIYFRRTKNIEEPVVKRGRGRPRDIKQPKEPKTRGRPRIERRPTISQKRWRKPNVRTGEPQEKQPKERPKFIQLDVSDILKMLNTNFEKYGNGKPTSRITI